MTNVNFRCIIGATKEREDKQMDKTKRKINVIGKICRIIATILTVLTAVGAGSLLTTGVVLAVIPDNLVAVDMTAKANVAVYGKLIEQIPDSEMQNFVSQINDGSVDININGKSAVSASSDGNSIIVDTGDQFVYITTRRVGFMLIVYSVIAGSLVYVFVMLRKLMRELEICESPFCDGVVKGMTGFAISLIPYAVLNPTLRSVATSLLAARNFDISIGNADFPTIFAVLIIILLIMIFKYGASLQKESDETL